jgi:cell division protein FtsQ
MRNVRQSKLETGRRRLQRRAGQLFSDGLKMTFLTLSILLVTVLLIFAYSHTLSTAYFGIRETQVRGCKELTEKDILQLAALKPAQNLLAVNADAIRDRIRKNPWIRDVYVGRELPERLVIEVRERTPVALLKKEDGFYLMDADGLAFKRLESGDESDLPALTGCYREGRLNGHLLAKSLELLRYLSASKEFVSVKAIAEVHGDEVLGFSIFTDSGLCLRLGFDHFENKINRLTPVIADLEKRGMPLKYILIDLTDPTKITVQKRQILTPATPGETAKGYRT